MKPTTTGLLERMHRTKDLFERIDLLKNAYPGETAYVLACGPSLGEIPAARLEAFLADKLVIAIKQAYSRLPCHTDFHIIHHSNLQRYRYPAASAPILVNEDEGHSFLHSDLLLPKVASDLYASVSALRNFDDYLLERNPIRPCGPGVMYEMVFYLAVHLGVRNIVVLGWDLYSDPEQLAQLLEGRVGQTHFYQPSWRQFLYDTIQAAPAGLEDTLERFREGEVVNRLGQVFADDVVLTAIGTRHFAEWLAAKGVRLFVTTDSPNVSRSIPRVDLFRTGDKRYLESTATGPVSRPEYPVFQRLLRSEVTVTAADHRLASGWHPAESWHGTPVRWSGPGAMSRLLLPLDRRSALLLTFECTPAPGMAPPHLRVDGKPFPVEWSSHDGISFSQMTLPAGDAWNEVFTLFDFEVDRVFEPSRELPGSTDPRKLGFAFRAIHVRPAGA